MKTNPGQNGPLAINAGNTAKHEPRNISLERNVSPSSNMNNNPAEKRTPRHNCSTTK